MGKKFFVSLTERIARVAQYAKNPSVWWNGKEYPWDKKRGKFMRWTGGSNPHPEEPGDDDPNPLFTASGLFPDRGGGAGDASKPETTDSSKPLPPMAANHPTSREESSVGDVKTFSDFLNVVEIVRSKTMSPEAAEYEKTKTRKFVADLREYITNEIEMSKLRERYRRLREQLDQGAEASWFDDMAKEKEKTRIDGIALKEKNKLFKEQLNLRKTNLSDEERENNLAFLRAAFPDRGGFSFFTPVFKKDALEGFRRLGREKDARYVLEFYDIIGKAFNFDPKGTKNPAIFFEKVSSSKNKNAKNTWDFIESRYDKGKEADRLTGKSEPSAIRLSNQEEHRDSLLACFAFRIGEWINEEVLSLEQMEDNQDWLQRETGDYHTPNFGEEYTIPQEKEPNLCIEPDGSSMKLAHPHFSPDSQKKNRMVFSTGVFPTGMQWLAIYPEMFAIQSPKHFDQILKNFRAFSLRTKKQ